MEVAESLSAADVLERSALEVVFQPIVTLPEGTVVAYEALTRGPAGTELERPDRLFAAARAEGLLAELDFACQANALRAAGASGLRRPFALFVNIEPEVAERMPDSLRRLYGEMSEHLDITVEITERSLTRYPAELLARVRDLRELGCSIAVDDVGLDERSLAMMPFLRPDVIKLDMSFVQRRPGIRTAEIAHAVAAESERTGASVLVEGVEHEAHADAGVSLGATLAQGWHFGRPEALPVASPVSADPPTIHPARREPLPPSPWELVGHLPQTRVAPKRLLFAMTRHLERQAVQLGGAAVILATFEAARFMTPLTRRRYAEIATRTAFCGALAVDLETQPAIGVRGVALDPGDPMAREWDVAVVAPHFAAALIGFDLGDPEPDRERRFRYALTYDRARSVAAARSMMARIVS